LARSLRESGLLLVEVDVSAPECTEMQSLGKA
jgi:hypothetical protein